ncbi:MAG: hypothetical protein VW915_05665, partial [Gammaproteobacteria bacterium]
MSSNTNIGNTPVNQGYVQLIHTGETGGIDGTLRTLYDGDGTASDLQIASNSVKVSTQLYIGAKTITEYVQDVVGDMFDTNGSHTNITATYDDDGDGAIDLVSTGEVTLTGTETLTNKTLASPTFTGTATGANLTLSGDLTVNGTTIAVDQTNLNVSDNIIGLNRGVSSNANDSGLIIERGSTGNNVFIGWDESLDRIRFATTTADASSTGNLSLTNANIHAGRLYADVTGALTGNVTGNVTGNLTGNVTGDVTGNADTATTLATARNFSLTGDVTAGAVSFDGSGNVALSTTIAADSVALGTDTTGNYVGTITAGSGVSTSGASTGEGIAHNLSINASQTTITSIYNSSLQIGSAADEQRIDFGTSDEIRLGSSTQTSVKIKTDPLGSAQDEVIIGDGTADVDFVVDNTSGTAIFKVDAGTGNTSITGDLNISGSFNPSTVTTTSVIATNYKHTTSPNNNAFTVGSTSGVEFVTNVDITGGNLTLEKGNGALLQLTTSESDVQVNDALGSINFFASNETGLAAGQLAASILAEARGQFDNSNNPTDLIFKLGTTGTATEQFRIYSSGGIKIGNAYTLPPSDGSANQILKTNGSGTLSFADESTGISFNGSTANGLLTYGNSTTADVEANLTFTGNKLNIESSENVVLSMDSTSTFTFLDLYNDNTNRVQIGNADDGDFIIRTNEIERFRINSTGDVNIKATKKLYLDGGGDSFIFEESANNVMFKVGNNNNLRFNSTGAIFNDAGASLDFRVEGDTDANLLFVDGSADRVGIGTTSPSEKLEVSGSNSDTYIEIHNNGGYESGIKMLGGSLDVWKIYLDDADNKLRIDEDGTAYMTISAGNVGIGTQSPGTKLEVKANGDTSQEVIKIRNNSGTEVMTIAAIDSNGDGYINFNSSPGTINTNGGDLVLSPGGSGNVGIGVTSPETPLHVNQDSNDHAFKVTGGGGGASIARFVRDIGVASPYAEVNIHAGSGDPQITFRDVGNKYFSIGIDDSANSFKISDNSAVGTNDRLTIDTSGNIRMPNNAVSFYIGDNDELRLLQSGSSSYLYSYSSTHLYVGAVTSNYDTFLRAENSSGSWNALQVDSSVQYVRLPNDNWRLSIGLGNDLGLYHDATNSWIRNFTGNLYIRNDTHGGDIY